MTNPPLIISEEDYQKISSLLAACPETQAEPLEEELSRAQVVPAAEVPEDQVIMHSTVTVEDLEGGTASKLKLVYPHEAKLGPNQISILAPMGVALIGLKCGQEAEWTMPNGKTKRFKVKEVRQERAD